MTESMLRLMFFLTLLVLLTLLEKHQYPKLGRRRHYWHNIALLVLGSLSLRLLPMLTAGAAAVYAEQNQIGLLNSSVPSMPLGLQCIVVIIGLDCLIYWQHRLFHRLPYLWKIHQTHHSDAEIDVSSGVRFHPLELFISQLVKALAVLAMGAPLIAVIIFELLLNACSLFIHAHIRLPTRIQSALDYILVTPKLHRIHHSADLPDTDKNFCTSVIIWDVIFGTLQRKPSKPPLQIGLYQFQQQNHAITVWRMLTLPFTKN